jgi:hypothetical protein
VNNRFIFLLTLSLCTSFSIKADGLGTKNTIIKPKKDSFEHFLSIATFGPRLGAETTKEIVKTFFSNTRIPGSHPTVKTDWGTIEVISNSKYKELIFKTTIIATLIQISQFENENLPNYIRNVFKAAGYRSDCYVDDKTTLQTGFTNNSDIVITCYTSVNNELLDEIYSK